MAESNRPRRDLWIIDRDHVNDLLPNENHEMFDVMCVASL
jgi:hypothetical protein